VETAHVKATNKRRRSDSVVIPEMPSGAGELVSGCVRYAAASAKDIFFDTAVLVVHKGVYFDSTACASRVCLSIYMNVHLVYACLSICTRDSLPCFVLYTL
jgi:hypothetical protein